MLPTFVIGLREGLEAALIVGIVAAFLRQRGRMDLLRWVFAGVGAAVLLCFAVGVTLDVVSKSLPQKQQEGLETVVGAIAVVMVTYMVVWMRRNSRGLKKQLEGAAGGALAAGSALALVVMAFLAVLREGFETVVFLLAAFNENGSGWTSGLGAVLGVLVAVALGYGIYRGGVRLNLSKFFRITGVVLVLVAAGLVVSALHTAHEAGWLNIGQQQTVDLSALVRPGSVQSSLLTGVLGVQSRPVAIEVIGWLLYLVPVGLYVAWPPGKGLSRRTTMRLLPVAGALALVAAVVLTVLLPATPQRNPKTVGSNGMNAQMLSPGPAPLVRTNTVSGPPQLSLGGLADLAVARVGTERHAGVDTIAYSSVESPPLPAQSKMTYAELAARNGGRLPLGVRSADPRATVPVTTSTTGGLTVWVDPATGRVIDLRWQWTETTTAILSIGPTTIGEPQVVSLSLPPGDASAAAARARADANQLSERSSMKAAAWACYVASAVLFLITLLLAVASRRRTADEPVQIVTSTRDLVRS